MTSAKTFISASSQRLLLILCFEVQLFSDLKEYVNAAHRLVFFFFVEAQEAGVQHC